jgi:hypothetical protein
VMTARNGYVPTAWLRKRDLCIRASVRTVSHGTTQRIGNIYEEREYERRIDYDEEDEEEAYYNEFGYHRSYSER